MLLLLLLLFDGTVRKWFMQVEADRISSEQRGIIRDETLADLEKAEKIENDGVRERTVARLEAKLKKLGS